MHIAFFNPQGNFDNKDSYWIEHPDFGGQLVYVKELAKALDRKGHQTVIFTRRIDDPDWPEFSQMEEIYDGTNVRIVRIDFGGPQFLSKEALWTHLAEYADGIRQWYRNEGKNPDLVTSHYGDGGIAGALFHRDTGIPFTFTAHSLGAHKLEKLLDSGVEFKQLDQQYQFSVRIAAERTAMRLAMLRVVSTDQERTHQYHHPLYRDLFQEEALTPFVTIPPGVNQSIFHTTFTSKDEDVAMLLHQSMKRYIMDQRQALPLVIVSSRLEPEKNVTGLVRAFGESRILQEKCNLLLVIRGIEDPFNDSGKYKGVERKQFVQIREQIRENKLLGKVAFINVPNQRSLAAIYRLVALQGGVFCLPSLYEPFGLATIEAMGSGLPVVVSSNGGGREILNNGESFCGMLINPEETSSIVRGILTMLSDTHLRKQYREAALKKVATRYTWDAAAEMLQNAIYQGFIHQLDQYTNKTDIPAYFDFPSLENLKALTWVEKAACAWMTDE